MPESRIQHTSTHTKPGAAPADPYWTLLPPLTAAYYRCHPHAAAAGLRGAAAAALVLAWSTRLTHSYFRREAWRVGAREDWRFADMRRRWPRTFCFTSLFLAYISQWPMLVGITTGLCALASAKSSSPPDCMPVSAVPAAALRACARASAVAALPSSLPLYALHFPPAPPPPLGAADAALLAASACALTIAYIADTQLYDFCAANARRRARGEAPVPVLQTGLWRYSRHPNYFGEQLWWWCVALLGWRVGAPWTMAGQAFNCACMVHVTRLTEARMLTGARADAYRTYTQRTSAWLPLPPSSPHDARAASAAAKSEAFRRLSTAKGAPCAAAAQLVNEMHLVTSLLAHGRSAHALLPPPARAEGACHDNPRGLPPSLPAAPAACGDDAPKRGACCIAHSPPLLLRVPHRSRSGARRPTSDGGRLSRQRCAETASGAPALAAATSAFGETFSQSALRAGCAHQRHEYAERHECRYVTNASAADVQRARRAALTAGTGSADLISPTNCAGGDPH
ncbi:hypothetical protein JKP88DRAFT_261490 [Tribonema minus]|uniref:Steroid 5-alpha reductase C-terminal domain-containing protein n=1 Tax=Tribonema minus TaxID=303371 RepID=A0A835YL69_9STRA|nr:hypothetical protein JKP88DRAFT_261490 [Tribonema minus]